MTLHGNTLRYTVVFQATMTDMYGTVVISYAPIIVFPSPRSVY